MKKTILKVSMLVFMFLTSAGLASCLNGDEETIVLEKANTGIPDDSDASANPTVSGVTTTIPNVQATVDNIDGVPIIRLDMTGVKNSDDVEWMRLYGTGYREQNVWVEVDGNPKGILVYNNADNNGKESIPVDIVFTVDNSGSMSQEANAVARDITSWAQLLTNSGLNVRFACVGYSEFGTINGGIDFTGVEELSSFLNRYTGTSRTTGWSGSNANYLSSKASSYEVNDECGAMAIRFADANLNFRNGANRIYVNFTDEPNQPNGKVQYSVRYFADQNNWPASKGTVHTVYSDTQFSSNTWYYSEQPWLISEYTGGTVLFASSSFYGVSLSDLPVTGAMENSYIIRFANIEDYMDGKPHTVHITILSKDGKVCADKVFTIVFGTL